jgi:hypothetical protein
MKKLLLSAASFAVVAVTAMVSAPTTSEAVPAYARQTGAACLSCHFQSIPRLNAFGRNFRINGHVDIGEQPLIEDDHMSLPATLNASLLVKSQATFQSTAQGGNVIDWPNEAAIWMGGRLSENVGGTAEWGSGGAVTTKVWYVAHIDNGLIAVGGGMTDALGANFMFNDPSNATSRPTRGWLSRPDFLDRSGVMTRGMTAFGAYGYFNDLIYVAVGGIIPHDGTTPGAAVEGNTIDFKMSPYLRAAVTTEVAGLDTVAGVYYASVKHSAINAAAFGFAGVATATTLGIDLQMQGDIGDLSVGFYLPVQIKGERAASANALGQITENAIGYAPALNVAFGHLGVRVMYDYTKRKNDVANTSTTRKRTTIGGWYSVAQNVELMLDWQSLRVTPVGGAAATTTRTVLTVEYVY